MSTMLEKNHPSVVKNARGTFIKRRGEYPPSPRDLTEARQRGVTFGHFVYARLPDLAPASPVIRVLFTGTRICEARGVYFTADGVVPTDAIVGKGKS